MTDAPKLLTEAEIAEIEGRSRLNQTARAMDDDVLRLLISHRAQDERIARLTANLNVVREALFPALSKREDGFGFNDDSAYYNLMGAIEDLKHQKADQVCINTIERVLGQLGRARAIFGEQGDALAALKPGDVE